MSQIQLQTPLSWSLLTLKSLKAVLPVKNNFSLVLSMCIAPQTNNKSACLDHLSSSEAYKPEANVAKAED